MQDKTLSQISQFALGLGFLLLIAFGILKWFKVPAGEFVDWLIGAASFWWLLVITTVPWNIFFQSKEILNDASESEAKRIPIDPERVRYIHSVAFWSVRLAVGLHVVSALGFYGLSVSHVTSIGYFTAIAALLLTILRPAIRAYEYLASQLTQYQREFRMPREDAISLGQRIQTLEGMVESQLRNWQSTFDSNDPESWVSREQRQLDGIRLDCAHVRAEVDQLRATNHLEHERLAREAQQSIAQLNADSQFLSQVREMLRFIKEA